MSLPRRLVAGQDGSVTLWLLGLCLLLLTLGGLALDLWHVVAARRSLVGVADAAAYAATSALDEDHVRTTGRLRLEPGRARSLAAAAVAAQTDARILTGWGLEVRGGTAVVRVTGVADTFLLGLVDPTLDRLPMAVTAVAEPRRG